MTKDISLDKLNIDEMLALKDKIEARLAKAVSSEVKELEKRLEELTKYSGKTASPQKKIAEPKKPAKGKRRSSALKGTKAPVKFRDSKSDKTWSGRGMTPIWIREHEAKGGKREDFSV